MARPGITTSRETPETSGAVTRILCGLGAIEVVWFVLRQMRLKADPLMQNSSHESQHSVPTSSQPPKQPEVVARKAPGKVYQDAQLSDKVRIILDDTPPIPPIGLLIIMSPERTSSFV